MKAASFTYHKPESVEAALDLLAADGAAALAGGQSLMPMMNFRLATPETLVDLNGLVDLAGVAVADGRLTIGAMTRYRELERSPEIAAHAPLIARALPMIAHPAIRNRGTIGGSCALADPAAEIPALLLALGGEIVLRSHSGERRVPAEAYFLGMFETARADNELVARIEIPLPPSGQRTGFHEIARRRGDYAMAGCAIAAAADLTDPRIALFGVADRPVRAKAAEAALPNDVDLAIAALAELEFSGDLHADETTKRHLAGIALQRAWAECIA